MTKPKYPEITVQLTGEDGNAFAMMGQTTRAMRRAGVSSDEVNAFRDEAMSDDYDHLIQTIMNTVNVV